MAQVATLLTRDEVAPTATGIINSVEFTITAWSFAGDEALVLEIADYPSAVNRVMELVGLGYEVTFRGPAGESMPLRLSAEGMWLPPVHDPGSGLAVATWLAAPPGRMMLDTSTAVPGAEEAPTVEEAGRALRVVIDSSGRSCMMLAGPQRLSAIDDRLALARMFTGLLKDCYHMPVPGSDAFALAIWGRMLEDRRHMQVGVANDGNVGVADMEGNLVEDAPELEETEERDVAPIQIGVGSGIRAFLLNPGLQEATAEVIAELGAAGELAALIGE